MINNQSHHENSTKRQYQTQPSQSGRSHSNAAHSSKAKAKDEYLAFKENLTSTTACPLNVVSSGASRVSSQGSSTQLPIISDNNCQGQERSSSNMKQPKRTSSLSNTGAQIVSTILPQSKTSIQQVNGGSELNVKNS